MVPTGGLYHVIVDGMAYPTDLDTLRQWIQQGRVTPETLVGKGNMKPIPAREVPALRDAFQSSQPPAYAPPSGYPPSPSQSYAPQPPSPTYTPQYQQPYSPPTPPAYAPPTNSYGGAPAYPSAVAPAPKPYGQAPVYGTVPAYVNSYEEPFPNARHQQDLRFIDAMKKIKTGWITGVVIGTLMFLIVTVVVVSGSEFLGVNPYVYVDVLIIYGLSFGIFRKSRVCAVLMVIYYILSKIVGLANGGVPNVPGIAVAVGITIGFVQAATGTFKYHELKAEAESGQWR